MSKPVGGRIYFTVGGRQYDLTGDFEIDIGGPTREGVPGLSGGGCGFTVAFGDGSIKCTLATTDTLMVSRIQQIEETKFSLECVNGRKYYGDRLYCGKTDPINPVKGTVGVGFGHVGKINEV